MQHSLYLISETSKIKKLCLANNNKKMMLKIDYTLDNDKQETAELATEAAFEFN